MLQILEPIFYVGISAYVYLLLIPRTGEQIVELCFARRYCSVLIRTNYFGYPVDLSDDQYRHFRDSVWLVCLASVSSSGMQCLLSIALRVFQIDERNRRWFFALFHAIYGLVFLLIQHGWHMFIVLGIISLGHLITKLSGRFNLPSSIEVVWIFALSLLFGKECYRSQWLRTKFKIIDIAFDRNKYGGMYPWHQSANYLILRIISYSVDWIRGGRDVKKSGIAMEGKKESGAEDDKYNFVYMLAYSVYAPLYIAGPVISYDDFILYLDKPQCEENTFVYMLRWVMVFGLMEYMCVKFPFFAVMKSGLVRELSPAQIAVVSYVILKMMWIKFLLIWRLFRAWALVDGIRPPENMLRCMSNNYSLEGFWRGWHSSFNKWIVQYMYIPLGGKSSKVWSVWIIFLFVAIWHDLEMKLMIWGALNSIFLGIELLGRKVYAGKTFTTLHPIIRRLVEVLAGGSYIFILIGVNMVGYSVGLSGTGDIVRKFMSRDGITAVVWSYLVLVIGVSIMRYIEEKKGSSNSLMLSICEGTPRMSVIQENDSEKISNDRKYKMT